jgi:hypothetical protein
MMKSIFFPVLTIAILAFNNQPGEPNTTGTTASAPAGDCGNSLVFRKGAELRGSVYDGQGKVTGKTVTVVSKVYDEGGMHVAELQQKSTDSAGGNEKNSKTIFKCDGKKIYVDLSSLMPSGQSKSTISTSAMEFPFDVMVGETLPDASYSVTLTVRGQPRTMISHIKERKVEALESITTPAGTFKCFRISSVVEVETGMQMDERQKKAMEQMKERMGKNRIIYWYAPDVTVVKMENYIGEKLLTRTEITGIKK